MACIFGGASAKAAGEVGSPIMSKNEKINAGIGSFDVISVTEKFATEHPDLLRTFLQVTEEANLAWTGSDAQVTKVSADAGMDFETTKAQMADFIFPSAQEQIDTFFNKNGIAAQAAASLGMLYSDDSDGAMIAKTLDGSYLK
jgi:taurine transport system substrate-binding protein